MTEQRLKVESGPPQHMISEPAADAPPSPQDSAAESAKDKAQDAAANAKDKAQQAAAPMKEKAREITGQAKEQAKTHAQAAAGQAKEKAAAQIDERSTQVGQQIGSHVEALDGVAEELRRQGKEGPAKIAEQASERVKGVASYLEQAEGESLIDAAKQAAHDNPAAAAAVGAAAGLAAGRVIKASMGDDASEQDDQAGASRDEGA